MEQIDVQKIMSEVEEEVERKKRSSQYRKDLEKLEELTNRDSYEQGIYDLLAEVRGIKSLSVPKSVRPGLKGKLSNLFFLKLYFVMTKMMDNYLRTQLKVNERVIKEIADMKRRVGMLELDFFPHREFREKFRRSEEFYAYTFETIKDYFYEKKRLVDILPYDTNHLSQVFKHNFFKIDIISPDLYIPDSFAEHNVKLINKGAYDGIKNAAKTEQYDILLLINSIEYMEVNYLLALLRDIRKAMRDDGYLVIQTKDASDAETVLDSFDPAIVQLYHPKLLRFMVEKSGYEIVQEFENTLIKGDRNYVFVIRKA